MDGFFFSSATAVSSAVEKRADEDAADPAWDRTTGPTNDGLNAAAPETRKRAEITAELVNFILNRLMRLLLNRSWYSADKQVKQHGTPANVVMEEDDDDGTEGRNNMQPRML